MEKKITKNEVIRCLYKTKKIQAFLRKHKCLTTFARQIDKNYLIFLHKHIIEDEITQTIRFGFEWIPSKEGFDFWNNLYKEAMFE